jgi:hypothetical protein
MNEVLLLAKVSDSGDHGEHAQLWLLQDQRGFAGGLLQRRESSARHSYSESLATTPGPPHRLPAL